MTPAAWFRCYVLRRSHAVRCPGCNVTKVIRARAGDVIECGACGRRARFIEVRTTGLMLEPGQDVPEGGGSVHPHADSEGARW